MGEGNIEVVQQLVDAVADQDAARLIELTDPDVEWHSLFAQLREGGVYRGHDGIQQYVRDLAETAESLQARIEDTMAVSSLVLAVGRVHYRGKGSGVDTEAAVGYCIEFRRGRVLQLRVFRDPEQVFRAAAGA